MGPVADATVDRGDVDVGIGDHAVLELELQNSGDAAVDALLAEFAAAHSVDHRLVHDVHMAVLGYEQLVDPGPQSQHAGDVGPPVLDDGVHVHRIGDDHAVVAHLFPEQAGDDRVRQGGRVAGRVEAVHHDVGGHDDVDAGVDRSVERRAVQSFPFRPGVVDRGEFDVAVLARVAVAGEVLGRRGDAVPALVTGYLGTDELTGDARVGAEAAHADDRIVRVDVDVGDGSEVLGDADGTELASGDGRCPSGIAGFTAGCQSLGTGELRCRGRHPGHDACLLVGGDHERGTVVGGRCLQAVGQPGHLDRVVDILRPGEVNDPTEVVLVDHLSRRVHPVGRLVL